MRETERNVAVAALIGACAVAMGAFASHGLAGREAGLAGTGARYAMWHALAMLATLALPLDGRLARRLFLAGVVLFAGSLWAMALGAPKALGMVTPVGGLCLIGGWLALAYSALRRRSPAADPLDQRGDVGG